MNVSPVQIELIPSHRTIRPPEFILAMEFFEGVRPVELKSHLDTYLCVDDVEVVSHGYRHNSCGTV
jgi:hypothetical protein